MRATTTVPPPWENLQRLGGVERPRVWAWPSGGLPGAPQECRENFAVLGQDCAFRSQRVIEPLLDQMERTLGLSGETWRSQRTFFREFIGSFFKQTDRPAWIKVHAIRRGFLSRTTDSGLGPVHDACLSSRNRQSLRKQDGPSVSLDGERISLRGARFYHPYGSSEDLELHLVQIQRGLYLEGRRPLCEPELRWVPIADEEDVRLARRGVTPTLEAFRQADGVLASPLVSLSRIDECGRIAHRIFALRPLVGDIADIRWACYAPEYYFRTDSTCETMLRALLTKGEYEPF